MKRNLWILLLAAMLFITTLPVGPALAENKTGSCGENVTWSLDTGSPTATLFISGSGAMEDFTSTDDIPWYNDRNAIRSIQIGYGVTAIGSMAFKSCSGATSVNIQSTVTSIGDCAFQGCSGITSLSFSDNLLSIGSSAFQNCSKLASVSIFNPDTAIGANAFANCASDLVIKGFPDSSAYIYATGENISFAPWVVSGRCGDSVDWSFNAATGTLTISGTGGMYDCRYADYNPEWNYYRSKITSVIIGQGVTYIGNFAFSECENLSSVTIPEGVTGIGNSAFQYCVSLKSVIIPNGVTRISGSMFYTCLSLENVTLPNTLTHIDGYAFGDCHSLKHINFPDGMVVIGSSAFSGCGSLPNVRIPDSVTTIDDHAFEYCRSFTEITIPASVAAIGNYAFSDCYSLKSICVLSPDVTIGSNAFGEDYAGIDLYGWENSTTQEFANTNQFPFIRMPVFFLPADLTEIGEEAFHNTGEKAVVIPKTVSVISGNPFADSAVVCIYGYPNSIAKTFADNNGYYLVEIDDTWMASHAP